MKQKFAAFDIDGTLIRWQLYHVIVDKLASSGALGPDAKHTLREARMVWKRREHTEAFKSYEHTLINLYEMALRNINTDEFDQLVAGVIDEYKDQTYVYTRDLFEKLKSENYFLLIISGSHHELIEQIGKYYGFDDWIGTRYHRIDGEFSGEKSVPSRDKASALKQLTDKHSLSYKDSLAIGDSASDAAMLELVGNPIAFNPDTALFETAKGHGWPIVVERKNMIYNLRMDHGRYILD